MRHTLKSLTMIALLAACGGLAGTAPAQGERDAEVAESLLELKVRAALLEKLGSDLLDVGVDAEGGRVVLTGQVESRANQELAEEVALAVEGVDKVKNRLKVRPKADRDEDTPVADAVADAEHEVNDGLLESRIKVKLLGELGRRAFAIEVEATEGVVTLRGKVPDEARRKIALDTAQSVSGVEEVIDLLKTPGGG